MKSEVFKFIPGLEPYEISENGTLRLHSKILTTPTSKVGYKRKYLKILSKNINVHKAVAMAFLHNPHNLPCINHMDGNKLNNHYLNLEWCTPSHNMRHAIDTGLKRVLKGQLHARAKLSELDVSIIRDALASGYSGRGIARYFNVSQYCISAISRGITWRCV